MPSRKTPAELMTKALAGDKRAAKKVLLTTDAQVLAQSPTVTAMLTGAAKLTSEEIVSKRLAIKPERPPQAPLWTPRVPVVRQRRQTPAEARHAAVQVLREALQKLEGK